MLYTKQIKTALNLVHEKHFGQFDKGGVVYVCHPLHVSRQVEQTEELICVALLHDIVEDTDVTIQTLIDLGFDQTIVDAIDAITKRKGESYADYLDRVKKNDLARKVKLEDLLHNMDLSRLSTITSKDLDRTEKYIKAYTELCHAEVHAIHCAEGCGTQRCDGSEEWIEGCTFYQNLIAKIDPIKAEIVKKRKEIEK